MRVIFYLADKLRTEVWDTASQITLRDCSAEVRGEPGYIQALTTRLLLIKENQISQVKEFSAFLCMGRFKSLDSLKIKSEWSRGSPSCASVGDPSITWLWAWGNLSRHHSCFFVLVNLPWKGSSNGKNRKTQDTRGLLNYAKDVQPGASLTHQLPQWIFVVRGE